MSSIDERVPLLKTLRLSGILASLELRNEQATDDSLSYQEFLLRLVNDEVERRDCKMLMQRLRKAEFEYRRAVNDVDFHFNPSPGGHADHASRAGAQRPTWAISLGRPAAVSLPAP